MREPDFHVRSIGNEFLLLDDESYASCVFVVINFLLILSNGINIRFKKHARKYYERPNRRFEQTFDVDFPSVVYVSNLQSTLCFKSTAKIQEFRYDIPSPVQCLIFKKRKKKMYFSNMKKRKHLFDALQITSTHSYTLRHHHHPPSPSLPSSLPCSQKFTQRTRARDAHATQFYS